MNPLEYYINSDYLRESERLRIRLNFSNRKGWYHNMWHLETMWNHLCKVCNPDFLNKYKDLFLYAILYHDYVYKPGSQFNEIASVGKFLDEMKLHHDMILIPDKSIYCNPDTITNVCELILATKTHKPTGNYLTDLFIDADLSMFGVSRDEFIEALNRIAYEHQLLDDYDNFLVKQNAFIKNLIKSRGGRIFTTETFRSSELHDNAFDNLTYLTNICFEIENKS